MYKNDFNTSITLYYEPIIYSKSKSVRENGKDLLLFRNNSISFKGREEAYYCPDFVVKFDNVKMSRYIILDAKFSAKHTTRLYHFRETAFKYIVSISTLQKTDQLMGLALIYGKADSNDDELNNLYTLGEERVDEIIPFAKMLSLTENSVDNGEQHEKILSLLFKDMN